MRERGVVAGTRSALTFAALALALAPWVGAQDATGQPQAKVSVTVRGLAGPILRGRPGRFVPVNVVLENGAGKDQDGVIRLYRADRPRGTSADLGLYYERRVSLPAGARRVETIDYYCQEDEPSKRLVVVYQPDEGTAPDPAFPTLEVESDRLAALIVSSREAHEAEQVLHAAMVAGPRRVVRVETAIADLGALPEHMVGYDPFDAVVVTDLNKGDVPPERLAALLEWVAAGNDLIVAFDGRSDLPDELRAALPVKRGAARAIDGPITDLRALGRGLWPGIEVAHIDSVLPAAGAEVLAGGARPLVIRGAWGAGRVTYLSFPLDAAGLRNWAGLPHFAGSLLRLPRSETLDRAVPATAPPLEELQFNLTEALETLSSPSALLVAPLLLLYVVLVSPLNYLVLSRRRRLGLSQPIAALVVLGFAALFYAMDRLYAGSSAITQIAIREVPAAPIDAPPAAAAAARGRIDTFTGYYSAREGLVSGTGPQGAALTPIVERNATSREGRVVQGAHAATLEQVTVVTKALRRFRALRTETVGSVGLDFTLEGSVVRGRYANHTAQPLDGLILILPHGYIELPRLGVGETRQLPGTGMTPWDDARPDSLDLVQAIRRDAIHGYPSLYGTDSTSLAGIQIDPYQGSVARRLLDTFRRRRDRVHESPGRLAALLVGRTVDDPGGVVIDGLAAATLARSFVLVETSVGLRGPLELRALEPSFLTDARDGFWTPVDGPTGAAPAIGGSLSTGANVDLVWTLPSSIEEPLSVDSLRVRFTTNPPLVLPERAFLDVWNVRLKGWVRVMDLSKATRAQDGLLRWTAGQDPAQDAPLDLVDPSSGAVFMRLVNSGVDFRLDRLVLDVTGSREKRKDEGR